MANIMTLINYLINNNINVQIGHSLADYNCCVKFMDKNNIEIKDFTIMYISCQSLILNSLDTPSKN